MVKNGPKTRWACAIVSKRTRNPYGSTGHIQFTSIFVKWRFKGDTSETSFRSLCEMAFWHQRTGHISGYSCPFDLVPSRIDSPRRDMVGTVEGVGPSFPRRPSTPTQCTPPHLALGGNSPDSPPLQPTPSQGGLSLSQGGLLRSGGSEGNKTC